MKIFVSGATGFLGRHLVPALRADGHDVTAVGSADCDLTADASLSRFTGPYDQIWHLAAWTQAGDFCLRHPGEQWIINQRINTNMLAWWQAHQPQAKLIAIGTSCSYAPGGTLAEADYLAGEPVPELYAYAMTKRMLLIGLRAIAAQYGLRYLYLVPSTLFGSGYRTAGHQLHFIFDLITKIARGATCDDEVVLWGDGHQARELVHVDEFVDAAIRLARRADNEIVNIGRGVEHPIRWYAEQICRTTGYDPARIRYDETRYVGVRSKRLSTDRLRTVLPDFTMAPLELMLEQVVREHLDALRVAGAEARCA